DSLPWAAATDRDDGSPRDPFADLPPLPDRFVFPRPPSGHVGVERQRRWPPSDAELRRRRAEQDQQEKAERAARALGVGPSHRHSAQKARTSERPNTVADPYIAPHHGESALGLTRTALCVEPRDGRLRVFMPPLYRIDAYLELVAAIEFTAKELGLPVQLEGYPPPRDP